MQRLGEVLGRQPLPTTATAARMGASSGPEREAPRCPICGGAGWVRQDVPVGHPSFGQAVPCACKAAELRQVRLGQLYAMSRLGEQLRGMTFDNFHTEGIFFSEGFALSEGELPDVFRNLGQALRHARDFAAEPWSWLVLSGGPGCGKTHLAVAIANARIARGEPALFQVVADLLDHLRATFSPNSAVTYDSLFDQVRSAPLLILDDFGAHSSSPWAEEKLFQIVNHRYNHRLPTVATTNLLPDQFDPRLVSRMTEGASIWFHIKAPDFRAGASLPSPALRLQKAHGRAPRR